MSHNEYKNHIVAICSLLPRCINAVHTPVASGSTRAPILEPKAVRKADAVYIL